MRCRGCGYRLWNLKPGPCPECGRAFIPSEHSFVPGRVRFQCPHCLQSYAGTDERGLPRPREFACATCQYSVRVDEMICVPAEGAAPDSCSADEHPWLRRSEIGWWRALWKTITDGMLRPKQMAAMLAPITPEEAQQLGAAEPPQLDARAANRFSGTILMLVVMANVLPILAFALGLPGAVGNPMSFGTGVILPPLVLAVIGCIFLNFGALITHLILRLGGPLPFKWRGTYVAGMYGYAPAALMIVPCLGPYCLAWPAAVWVCISSSQHIMRIQRVSALRAAVAVVLANLLLMAVPFGLFLGVALLVPRFAGPFPPPPAPSQPMFMPQPAAPASALDPNAQPLPGAEAPEEEQPADDQLGAQPDPDAG